MLKVLGIVCSPRKDGNTEIMVKEALEAAKESGADTELILVADKNISPCEGCDACDKNGVCKIKDDMQMIYEQLERADGIILGTPVYFRNVSAQAKIIIDRTFSLLKVKKLKGKVAATIVVAGKVGAGQTLSLLYNYFQHQEMIVAGGGIGYGGDKGEVRESMGGDPDRTSLEVARTVGRNVVQMINQVSK